ncbi:MAG: D-glycerate dehydrogenase [Ignavibacteriaceae bacterium]|nr:D-glycerate dehydrogenase [Ignavibacteriaceae bacterium]
MKVFITRDIPEVAYNLLQQNRINFDYYKEDRPIPKNILRKKVKDCDALIPLLTEQIDSHLIDQMPNCKVIANYAVGYNNIDVEYAKSKKIFVTNTPNVLTESTADLTIALVLACARRLCEAERIVRLQKYKGWKPKMLLGVELKGKIFGILGAGRIGSAVAARAHSFGTKIIYYDSHKNYVLEKNYNAKKVTLNTLLGKSDFISVHLPLNENTHHFLNKERLSLVKPTAILINTARGEIIDESYLIKMLKKNKIRSAGFDVYENEPAISKELLKLSNVVLLAHIGSATEEARDGMAILAVRNVINVLKGKKPITPVY